MTRGRVRVILCNGAAKPSLVNRQLGEALRLDYRDGCDPNVRLSLPDFVRDVYHLPDRVLDLLEIASYVFAADRMQSRGRRVALDYDSWSRSLHFAIKVRHIAFWSQPEVVRKLGDALRFVTGDRVYQFSFQPGHSTPRTSLFDTGGFRLPKETSAVLLFSGGVDSLTGALEQLTTGAAKRACLVSHRSQPGTVRTQKQLAEALERLFPGRAAHYTFDCVLHGQRAVEETQRSRVFLYISIAYALAYALSQSEIFVYENGMTALNFARREDSLKARVSRTTHPKTIQLLNEFFSEVSGSEFTIRSPFSWMTKADVLQRLAEMKYERLLSSTVSCSKTFQRMQREATHCGTCSQCVERRFAAYAVRLDDIDDSGLYALDFIRDEVKGEGRTVLLDFARQGKDFAECNLDRFYTERAAELVEASDGLMDTSEQEVVEKIWQLCRRHGEQLLEGIRRMREAHDNPYKPLPDGSFLHMVSEREYLKAPTRRFVETVCRKLLVALPLAFQQNLPKDESDFNDKVSAILMGEKSEMEREHPAVRFALAHAVPDHSALNGYVFIESKYIRKGTTPAKANEGMAADVTNYGTSNHILFLVYDPNRSIADDERFKSDFEGTGRCSVCILR